MQHRFQLGETAKDIITGVEGVLTARYEYLNGCVRYNLQPRILKDGMPVESLTLDQEQLDHTDGNEIVQPFRSAATTGGDRPAPKPERAPLR